MTHKSVNVAEAKLPAVAKRFNDMNTKKNSHLLACSKWLISGGHETRTRSPLRGTSVPVRPLTNSLILRMKQNRRCRSRLEWLSVRCCPVFLQGRLRTTD